MKPEKLTWDEWETKAIKDGWVKLEPNQRIVRKNVKLSTSCLHCGIKFETTDIRLLSGRGKYCSKKCSHVARGLASRGENHPMWKGDSVGYFALHSWVIRRLGSPQECSKCHTTTSKKFEWANISREYKRDLTDWKRLCKECHLKYDEVLKKGWETRHALSR